MQTACGSLLSFHSFVREKTGEILDTFGVAGEILRMELPGSRRGDMLRGPVRNHRKE